MDILCFIDLYYGGEALALEQPQAYTCPFCNRMGFTDTALLEHVTAEHADTTLAVSYWSLLCFYLFLLLFYWFVTSLQVVCPVCASMPGGEPNFVTHDFAGHFTLEHRTGPRDLISFLISFFNIILLLMHHKTLPLHHEIFLLES